METILIVAPHEYGSLLRSRLPREYTLLNNSGSNSTIVTDGTSRIYLARNDDVRRELEPSALKSIETKVANPVFYTLDYSDLEFVRTVLLRLVDDPLLLVDNDHGTILPGNEFAALLRSRTDWDWRGES